MDADEVVRELGLGLLRKHKAGGNGEEGPIAKEVFLRKWKTVVGDTFADKVSMSLIAVRLFCSSELLCKMTDSDD